MSNKELTSDNLSSIVIKRRAINSSGCPGSFYDACRDDILRQRNVSVKPHLQQSLRTVQCVVINGKSDASRNLFRSIGVEDDLRLSLLLNLTPTIGIAAVISYPHRINEHTRFLHYSWIDREEQVSNDDLKHLKMGNSTVSTTSATHMITGVSFGIDVLVVLQLPSENRIIIEIDRILKKISHFLSNGNDINSTLNSEENDLLRKITSIAIYSNIAELTGLHHISDVLHQIEIFQKNSTRCPPVLYSLRPLNLLHPQYTGKGMTIHTLPPAFSANLEQYILKKRMIVANLKKSFQKNMLKHLDGHLEGRFFGAYKQWVEIEKERIAQMNQFSDLIINFRSGLVKIDVIKNTLSDKEQTALETNIHELIEKLNNLEAKAHLINDLLQQNFEYLNAIERDVSRNDNDRTIQTKLIKNEHRDRILCSNDTLNKNNQNQLNKLRSYLIQERQNNLTLRLIYADFSYCTFNLPDMMIIPSKKSTNDNVSHRSRSQLSAHANLTVAPLPTDESINILLLGETGIGKSTFINAFANYLTFNSLEQAQSNEPMVLIPVSFLMTIGDNFEERTVKFGDVRSSINEDFNHPGQSATQQCKSYIFHLNRSNGKKLRIIDTPGFGDTRGLDQDDRNMQHILGYIKNLTHLNAVCFLLKPNASRLNIFFRTYFTQLFSLLGPNARQNIIFCFTNARSTFYTPGNTAPLLRTMLQSFSMSDIPFRKENTFCFDSESFRYLVARRNRISFNDGDKREYEMSWSTSVKESNRLIDYISNHLTPYLISSGRRKTVRT